MQATKRSGACARAVACASGLLLFVALGTPTGHARAQDDVEIRTHALGGGLAMLVGRGGNVGVSTGPDGVFLIDDQYAPLTPKILAAVAALDPGPVRFVLNTHWHGDHTGGNENLAGVGALIMAHENVRARLSEAQFIAALDRTVPASPKAARPVVTFAEGVTVHLNGQTLRATHVEPAHTDGDTFVHVLPADVLHTGDLYFAGAYPFFDLSSGGRFDGVIAAADRMLAVAGPETRIIPGHGPLSSRAELADWRAMLVDVRARIQARIDAGDDLAAILAARPTRAWDARYGGGFVGPEAFVRLAHASLTAGD